MNTCVKIIDNCLDCNSCFVDRILTADSWDHEEGAYCKEDLKNGKPRLIASDDWDLRKWSKVPDWCPKLIKSRLNELRIKAGVLSNKKFDEEPRRRVFKIDKNIDLNGVRIRSSSI